MDIDVKEDISGCVVCLSVFVWVDNWVSVCSIVVISLVDKEEVWTEVCVSPKVVDLEEDWEGVNSEIKVEEILICD